MKKNNIKNKNKKRLLNNNWQKVVFWISISYSLFNIYSLIIYHIVPWTHLSVNIIFTSVLVFIIFKSPLEEHPLYSNILDGIFIIVAISCAAYYAIEYLQLCFRLCAFPTKLDIIFATLLIIVVFEITRRTNGIAFTLVGLFFLIYAIFGHYIPGPLGHSYFSFERIVSYLYSDLAIYGPALYASASYVFLFILFGSFLNNFGAGEIFIKFATGIAGHYRGGPAKVAVLASSLFGTIAGSSIANVAATGSFTIPLMKKTGYRPEFAGGVEAAASTGGQIMPPVMGSTAFILAEIVGISYATLALKAILPAIFYFFAVLIMVDCEAIKSNLKGIAKSQLPSVRKILVEKWPFLMPIVVIFLSLLVFKVSTTRAATFGIFTSILAPLLSKGIKINIHTFLKALSDGAIGILNIVSACLTAGIIIGILALTGVGLKIGNILLALSGGNMFLMLVAGMILSLILGMGLPTLAAYIIAASVVGPALTMVGVPMVTAHLFIFYFSLLAMVTPPVALASYTAAGIANVDASKVGWEGFKLSFAAFVVPYIFVYNPALLLDGSLLKILYSILMTALGIIILAYALNGYFFGGRIILIQRIALLGAAILLMIPNLLMNLLAIIFIFILTLFNRNARTLILKKIKKYPRIVIM